MLESYREKIQKGLSKAEITREEIKTLNKKLDALNQRKEVVHESLALINLAAKETQDHFKHHLSDIVSLALSSVWEDPYKFKANFVNRRNSIECDLKFERDGRELNPFAGSGFGTIDIASFALRIAYLGMSDKRPTIIWDEMMRQLSQDKHELASQMIRELSEKLGVQMILITHPEGLTVEADRIYDTTIKNRKTKMEKVK